MALGMHQQLCLDEIEQHPREGMLMLGQHGIGAVAGLLGWREFSPAQQHIGKKDLNIH